MTAASQSDASVQYLEDKLSLLRRGQSDVVSRNAALDILTGRMPQPAFETDFDYTPRAVEVALPAAAIEPRPAAQQIRLWIAMAMVVLSAAFVAFGAWRQSVPAVEQPVVAAVVPAIEPIAAPAPPPLAAAPVTPVEPAPPMELPSTQPAEPVGAVAPQSAVTLRVVLDERFASNERGWLNDPLGTAWLGGGAYQLSAKTPSRFVAVAIPGTADVRDSVLTASFKKTGGPAGGGYGLILRNRDAARLDGSNQLGHYYVFEVGDRGEVGVWLRDGDRWVDLLAWSASEAVRPGSATNELTVSATGDQLSFLVNGIPVASQLDGVLHTGAAGIFVGGDGNQVSLEHLILRVPS